MDGHERMSWWKVAQSLSDEAISGAVLSAVEGLRSRHGPRLPLIDRYYVDLGGKAMWIENQDPSSMAMMGMAGGYFSDRDLIYMPRGGEGMGAQEVARYYEILTHELTHGMQYRRRRGGADFRASGEEDVGGVKVRTERAYHDRNIEIHARMMQHGLKGVEALRELKRSGKPLDRNMILGSISYIHNRITQSLLKDMVATMRSSAASAALGNAEIEKEVGDGRFIQQLSGELGLEGAEAAEAAGPRRVMQRGVKDHVRQRLFKDATRRMRIMLEAEARKLWPEAYGRPSPRA